MSEPRTGPLNPSDLVAAVHEAFPDLPPLDGSAAGLVHLEVAHLRQATQRAVDDEDRAVLRAHLSFVADAHRRGDDAVRNALGLSYLRRLNLRDGKVHRAWALALIRASLLPDLRDLQPELFD